MPREEEAGELGGRGAGEQGGKTCALPLTVSPDAPEFAYEETERFVPRLLVTQYNNALT